MGRRHLSPVVRSYWYLTAVTYQAPNALASKLTGYVNTLASFGGGKVGEFALMHLA
jgi:hypothetical protein